MTQAAPVDRRPSPAVLAAAAGWLTVSDAILSGLCHDLGNRLACMEALVELAEDDDAGLAEDMAPELERLSDLIPWFRALRGDMDAEAEAQLITETLPEVLRLHRPRRGLEGVERDFVTDGELPPVLANRARLGRLLILLMDGVTTRAMESGEREMTVRVSGTPDEVAIRMGDAAAPDACFVEESFDALTQLAAWDGLTLSQSGGEVCLTLPSLARARAREA